MLGASPKSGKPLIFIVPEQMTFQIEDQLARKVGGMTRAHVLSFSRLAYRVLQEVGGFTRDRLHKPGMHMLLKKVIEKTKPELRVFQKAASTNGFIEEMERLLTEMRRQALTADVIKPTEDANRTAFIDKQHDLHLIFQEFENQFDGVYLNQEEMLKLALVYLPQSELFKGATVFIDGFHDVSQQEQNVLFELLNQVDEMTMALTLPKEPATMEANELDRFYLPTKTFIQFAERLKQQHVPYESVEFLPGKRYRASGVALIEQNQDYSKKSSKESSDGSIEIVEAVNRRVEIEAVARSIREKVRVNDLRYKDFALLLRDISPYEDLIKQIFKRYEIAFFLDDTRTMMHHPVVELIRSSLESIIQNYRYEPIFRAFKTDLFNPLDVHTQVYRERIDELENYVLATGIYGKKWRVDEHWSYSRSRHALESRVQTDQEREIEERLNDTKITVATPLLTLEKRLKKSENVEDMCKALYQFLLDVDVDQKLERLSASASERGDLEQSSEHDQVWSNVIEVLEQFVDVSGTEKMSVKEFASMMDAGLESMSFRLVPPALDQVTIADMERSRLPDIEVTYIVGCNEGVIPKRPQDDGLLTEAERTQFESMGVTLGPSATNRLWHEPFYIYMAEASPKSQLLFTYALADEEGSSLLPSSLIRQVKERFPDVKHELVEHEANGVEFETQLQHIAHPTQVIEDLARQFQKYKHGEEISIAWYDVYHWLLDAKAYEAQLRTALDSLTYKNEAVPISETLTNQLYGEQIEASVSRMELFEQCAFRHFSQYGLQLRDREVFRLEAFDIGELFHAALKEISDYLKATNQSWKTIRADECRDITQKSVERLLPKIQRNILESTNHFRYVSQKLLAIVQTVTQTLRQQAQLSNFETIDLEVQFGKGTSLPSPVYPLSNGTNMLLRGRIDRVDRSETESGSFLQVIDYKSSKKTLSFSDVLHGISLQMPVYLDIVVNGSKSWLGIEADVGGMFYFHIHNPVIDIAESIDDETLHLERFKQHKLSGWLQKDPTIASLMDETLPEYGKSHVVPATLKKDGGFHSNSKVIEKEQLQAMHEFLNDKITEIGNEMTSGKTAIDPYNKNQEQIACTYCPFNSVCQFDPTLPDNEYKPVMSLSDKDALSLMVERVKKNRGETN